VRKIVKQNAEQGGGMRAKNNSRLTTLFDKIWFASTIGFFVGLVFLICKVVFNNTLGMIGLVQLMTWLTAMMGILILGRMWNKWLLGELWSNQHWLERLMTFVSHSCYGIVLSAIAYNIFVLFVRR
jgi:hypothetical protein